MYMEVLVQGLAENDDFWVEIKWKVYYFCMQIYY